jgi:transcriptional regulator with XRE-family HTH domain
MARRAPTPDALDESRVFEEEYLFGDATDTISAILKSKGITQKELAARLGVSAARVSQIVSGDENLTLRSLASIGWALGVRFQLAPVVIEDQATTPAWSDDPHPKWLPRLAERVEETARAGQSPAAESKARPGHPRKRRRAKRRGVLSGRS